MNKLPTYILDRKTNLDDLARFIPDGEETNVGDAIIASGLFDGIPALLFQLRAASVLVLQDDPGEFTTNLTAGELQADAAA